MKRTAFLLALCLGMTAAFCACGSKDVSVQQTQTQEWAEQDVSVPPDETDGSAGETAQPTQAEEGESANSVSAQTGRTAAQTASDGGGSAASAQTTSDGAPASVQTTGAANAAKTGEAATVTAPADAATAPGSAAKTTPGTGKTDKSDTTSATTATGQSGSASSDNGSGGSTGNGGGGESDTTRASVPTTESTTAYVPAEGKRVNAKMTYLKEAAVTYVSALKEDDLKRFNITGDKAKEILKNKSDWTAYTIQVDFRNDETMPITIYYLDVKDNGEGDVYVNGDLSGDLGLVPGAKLMERFYVLAKKNDSDGSVLQKLQKMTMRVQYAATLEDDMATPTFVYADVIH